MAIHKTAIIEAGVELDGSVEVGPYCVIKGKTQVAAGTILESHVSIGSESGIVKIGKNNHFYQSAVIGGPPQDLKYNNEPTELIVGDNNQIREFVTMNIGTVGGGGVTKIGSHNLITAYVHLAHDCMLGDYNVIAGSTQLAGHVTLKDHVTVGGCCGLSQFITLGNYSYIGGFSSVNKDVLPYTIAEGNWAVSRATNKIGMERAGYSKEEIQKVHKAVRIILKGKLTTDESIEKIKAECGSSALLDEMIEFIQVSKKGIAR